jgi:hypothetical protein
MRTYSEACELAMMSARNSHHSTDKQVARELWKMAQEYQTEAAKLDRMPDLGNPPQGLKDEACTLAEKLSPGSVRAPPGPLGSSPPRSKTSISEAFGHWRHGYLCGPPTLPTGQPTSIGYPKVCVVLACRRSERFSSCQLLQQRLCFLQIALIVSFGKPAIDLSEQLASLIPLAPIAPQPRKACCRAQLE